MSCHDNCCTPPCHSSSSCHPSPPCRPPSSRPVVLISSGSSCTRPSPVASSSAYPAYATAAAVMSTNSPAFLRQNARKEGFLVKQGGIIKNWKRRLFILNGMALYYFVSPTSPEPQGVIQLKGASVALNNGSFPCSSNPKFVFAVDTPSRRFYVEADNQLEFDSWIDAIQSAIRGKVTQFYSQPLPEEQRAQAPYTATNNWPSAPPPTWVAPQAAQSGYSPIYPSLSASGVTQLPQQAYPPPQQQPYAGPPPAQPPPGMYGNGYATFGGVVHMSSGYSSNAYPYPVQYQ